MHTKHPAILLAVLISTVGCESDETQSGAYEERATGRAIGLNEGHVVPKEKQPLSEDEEVDVDDRRVFSIVEDPGAEKPVPVREAVAVLHPTEDNQVQGTVRFTAVEGEPGLKVVADLENLPEGTHAFHVHLYGDCSGPHGKSAGTHFNFEGSSKNPPASIARITGNLGELEAKADGMAHKDTSVAKASLSGDFSILGRAVIVHQKGNDPDSPPIGAAGARLACGTIGIAEAGSSKHASL